MFGNLPGSFLACSEAPQALLGGSWGLSELAKSRFIGPVDVWEADRSRSVVPVGVQCGVLGARRRDASVWLNKSLEHGRKLGRGSCSLGTRGLRSGWEALLGAVPRGKGMIDHGGRTLLTRVFARGVWGVLFSSPSKS